MELKRKIRFGPRPPDPEPKTRQATLVDEKPKPKKKRRRKQKTQRACVCSMAKKNAAAPGEAVSWNCPAHGTKKWTKPGDPGWVRIYSQYDGFCRVCKEDFTVGTLIYWKKGHGARHAQCHETKSNTGEEKMGVWDGIEDAETFDRGNYIKGGFVGVVEIKKTIVKQTRAIGPAFIVEMEVVETNMEEHPVGQRVTWFQKLTDKDVAFPAVAEWAAAVGGIDPSKKEQVKSEVSPHLKELMDHATDNPSDNDFVGQKVRLQTAQIKTKNDRDFTRHTWQPYEAAA